MIKINKNSKGFTLIEIIVSLAVFSTVVLIILGAVLAIMNLQRRTNSFRVAQENISYAFESMAKEMRTGFSYKGNPTMPSDNINFINDQGKKVFYRLSADGQIEKCTAIDVITPCSEADYISLTSSEVNIKKLSFYISGNDAADEMQPMVKIILSGTVGEKGTRYFTEFLLQTVVTQRKIDS